MKNGIKVLELFAGTRSIGKAAEQLGYEVFSSDMEPLEGIHYVTDIFDFDPKRVPFKPDIIWASPPCTAFSTAAMGRHWGGGKRAYLPKSEGAKLGIKLLERTIELINHFDPPMWYIENPRGLMRKMKHMLKIPLCHTVTYCQYGFKNQKPTDIWTNNMVWRPKPACSPGAACHDPQPRSYKERQRRGLTKMGTMGMKNARERGMMPHDLCLEIMAAVPDGYEPLKQERRKASVQERRGQLILPI